MKSLCITMAIVGALALSFASAQPVQNDERKAKQWEHLALTQEDAELGGDLGAKINQLGAKGWELVGVTPIAKDGTTVKTRYYFKRPR